MTLAANGGNGVGISTGILTGGASVAPAQVTVDLAAGYTVPTAPIGTPVGIATVSAISGGTSALTLAIVAGQLTADDPARYANDPSAQACAAGPYLAVWKLESNVFGLDYTLPVFVEHPAGDAQRIELRFCPPALTDANGKAVTPTPMPLANADFLLMGASGPSARGSYTSSALVTPLGSTGAPDTASTVEARSLEPIPHTLTAKGRYDAKTHDAVLTGRVTEVGKAQAGAVVDYVRLESLTEPRHVKTSGAGTFTARTRIAATTTFDVVVLDAVAPCSGPSTAPRGCASETVIGTNDRLVRVVVPKR